MPYLNGLASKYGLATQYFANTHPSIGNYFMLTTGQVITNDDHATPSVTQDNMVRELVAAGRSWKVYAESLPKPGYIGPDAYPYVRHHNPMSYFSDVTGNAAQQMNIVPLSQLATDLVSAQLPNFSLVLPNMLHDGHDGTLQQADGWLQTSIAPLIASPAFQQNGLLMVVFDESDKSDPIRGGGHVAMLMIGPTVKPVFQSTAIYQHQSALRLILKKLGVQTFPGAAATAPDMNEFFAK